MESEAAMLSPLQRAIAVAGGQSALGRIINRRQSTVFYWIKNGKPLPAELVSTVAGALDMTPAELRPDLFGPQRAATVHVPANDRGITSGIPHECRGSISEASRSGALSLADT